MIARIFRLSIPKKHRAHQTIEIFQLRHPEEIREALTAAGYDELNKNEEPDDNDDWTDETENTPAAHNKRNKSARMHLCTRVIRGLFAKVSPEELKEIEEEVDKEKRKLRKEELENER
jgi:hypothetical protein